MVFALGAVLEVFACGASTTGRGGGAAGKQTMNDGGAGLPPVVGEAGADTVEPGNTGGAGMSGQNTGGTGCEGLACDVQTCAVGATTISGKVFAPNGTLPLYNVSVFVPNALVPEFQPQLACDRCGENDVPSVVRTTSDHAGNFVLEDAPVGKNIPLVIQVGRWRRQIVIPSVQPCVETKLEAEQTRLPRNKTEGDIPRMAVLAGGGDDELGCFPRRLGIDDAEFTTSAGDGSIHLYGASAAGPSPGVSRFDASLNGGAMLPVATELWASPESLQKYDLVLLGCEGGNRAQEKPLAARQAMYDYTLLGGRMLALHWQNIWFSDGPGALSTVGTWTDRQDPIALDGPLAGTVNQTFPKGAALAQWLFDNDAATTLGGLSLAAVRDNLQAVNPKLSRDWVTADNPAYPDSPKMVALMSFTTPVGAPADQACGRAAYADLHVSPVPPPDAGAPPLPGFPLNCSEHALSAQEKAIAFMLFELSSCIAPTDIP
jgi:hypothetical protein